MLKKRNVHGEGNYEATRKYNEGLRNFIRSGRVGRAARDAEPERDAEDERYLALMLGGDAFD